MKFSFSTNSYRSLSIQIDLTGATFHLFLSRYFPGMKDDNKLMQCTNDT
ncbi:hypothetical protein D083_1126 [Dickeya solani RNS 08.23.3.1.A]|nr:hypothetical protein D083_1126 [Dickeya solani RNS 08.23.3.1.A]